MKGNGAGEIIKYSKQNINSQGINADVKGNYAPPPLPLHGPCGGVEWAWNRGIGLRYEYG